jgi:penicillin-binding protein 1A
MKGFTLPKRNKTPNSRGKKRGSIIITVLSIIVSAIVVAGLTGTAVASLIITDILEDKPTLNVDDFISPDSTKIYDADGELIADIGFHLRENITYEQMPQSLIDAFVAVEDSRFFIHNGFDLPRFTKALIENLQSGSFGQGGSTFTMQLVKNTYFVTEETLAARTLDRKFQEIALAIELEESLSKKRILELYVNKVNYGVPNSLGIQTAAQYYFGKEVEELNLSESAFLAGVINAPNLNNPYRNLETGTRRRNVVLDLMVRHGYITTEEAQQAKSIKLENLLIGNQRNLGEAIPYQSYVDVVVEEVIRLTGKDPYTTPMTIYTHMNRDMQEATEAIANEQTNVDFGHDLLQMASISMDHTTGQIIAISGGRNYSGQRVLNRATQSFNQMGSSIKPVLSYALAFEFLGYATSHVIRDEPITYRNSNIIIRNFDRRYVGDMRFEVALALSRNIPAVKILEDVVDTVGVSRVVEYMNAIGFPRVNSNNFNLSNALGSFEVSVLELTGAYGMLFNQGVYIQPHTVARIEFKDGTQPIVPSYASTRALSTEAAYLATSLMERSVSGNYPNYMGMLGRSYPVYAKTGTTDWGNEGVRWGIPEGAGKEYWIVGGTSKYVNTVWIGFDRAEAGEGTWITSNIANRNLRGNIMKLLLDKQGEIESNRFTAIPRPSGVVDITHILGTFPYANIIEGMNSDLITTGMIKREFANLTQLTVADPDPLDNMEATYSISGNTNTINVTLTGYPTPEQLQVAGTTVEMNLQAGGRVESHTGVRLFHPSWIYGPIRYVATATVNNNRYVEVSSSNTITIAFDGQLTSNFEVCGFYAYEYNLDARSNQVCQTIDISTASITVPNFSTLSDFQTWATTYNITNINYQELIPNNTNQLNRINTVTLDGSSVMARKKSLSELQSGTFEVSYYVDRDVDLSSFLNRRKDEVEGASSLEHFNISFSPNNAQNNWRVTSILRDGTAVTSVKLISGTRLTFVLVEPSGS